MKINIETNYIPLIHAYDPPYGITNQIIPVVEILNGVSLPVAAADFIVGQTASAQVFGSWIYDKLKNHKDKTYIKIDQEQVAIDEASIIRVIKRKIETDKVAG